MAGSSPLRVYIAGSFKDWQGVRIAQEAVCARGARITYDWTLCAESPPKERSRADRAYEAQLCLKGVHDANVVLALLTVPTHPYQGTLCELTAATILGKRVIVVDTIGESSIAAGCFMYYHECIERYSSIEEAIERIFN